MFNGTSTNLGFGIDISRRLFLTALVSFLEALEQDVHNLQQTVKALTVPETMEGASSLERFLEQFQSAYARIREVSAFVAPDRAECE